MIPFEIFESVEICMYVHRFLFEFAKYIYRHYTLLHAYIPTVLFLIYDPVAQQIFESALNEWYTYNVQ